MMGDVHIFRPVFFSRIRKESVPHVPGPRLKISGSRIIGVQNDAGNIMSGTVFPDNVLVPLRARSLMIIHMRGNDIIFFVPTGRAGPSSPGRPSRLRSFSWVYHSTFFKNIYNKDMANIPFVMFSLLIPVMILIFGVLLSKYPPGSPKALFGYRTIRSMKSQQNWDFAQKETGILWKRLGLIDIAAVFILDLLFARSGSVDLQVYGSLALVAAQLIPLVITFIIVERKLKDLDDKKE